MNFVSNKNSVFEYIIKKSKFIAMLIGVNSTNEIKKVIEEIKLKHSTATHICYAFVLLEDGIKEKSFDDGEPSGTAGKPILDCIKRNKLVNTLIVVIRYFGGVKLGAGGLIRAYNQGAKSVIETCKDNIIAYTEFEELDLQIKYNKFEDFKNFCKKNNIEIISSLFCDNVIVKIKKEKGSEINFESYKN